MLENMTVKYFSYCLDKNDNQSIKQITENNFWQLSGHIEYNRYNNFINLTIEPLSLPHIDELERV